MDDDIILPTIGLRLTRDFILKNCYAQPGDIVVVGGTLIEGIGNACSDIDVYVITDHPRLSSAIDLAAHYRVLSSDRNLIKPGDPAQEVALIHTMVPGTAIKVDVEFKTFDEVRDLFARIDDLFDYARANLILLTKRLSDREECFIHRMLHGKPVMNAAGFESMVETFDRNKFVYLCYRWIASDFPIVLDLIGAWRQGELDRAVEFARDNAFNQTAGFLRLHGITNMRRKWLLTYLRRIDAGGAVLARFMDIMYMRGTEDEDGKRAYVLGALDYVDELFALSRPLLARLPGVPSGEEGLAMLEVERARASDDGYRDWEFDYRAKAYGAGTRPTRLFLDNP